MDIEKNPLLDEQKPDGQPQSKGWLRSIRVVVASLLFMTIGPALILTNKYIMTKLHFKFPITLSSFGLLTTGIIVHIGANLGFITIRQQVKDTVTFKYFARHILPIGLLQALTLNFGNRVYLYLSVSIIQMLKAFTPVVTLGILILTRQETAQLELIGAVGLLSLGTFVTAFGRSQSDSSLWGFLYMGLAELAEATKLALKQKLLQGSTGGLAGASPASSDQPVMKFSVFETLFYYAPSAMCWSLMFSLPLEYDGLFSNFDDPKILSQFESTGSKIVVSRPIDIIFAYPLYFCLAGLLGFGVNFGAFFLTKLVSGLFLKALGQVRNICLVIFSVLFLSEIVTGQQVIGYFVTLVGFFWYNHVRTR